MSSLLACPEDPQQANLEQTARGRRAVGEDQNVEGITVVGKRTGYKAKVAREFRPKRERFLDRKYAVLVMERELAPRPFDCFHDGVEEARLFVERRYGIPRCRMCGMR